MFYLTVSSNVKKENVKDTESEEKGDQLGLPQNNLISNLNLSASRGSLNDDSSATASADEGPHSQVDRIPSHTAPPEISPHKLPATDTRTGTPDMPPYGISTGYTKPTVTQPLSSSGTQPLENRMSIMAATSSTRPASTPSASSHGIDRSHPPCVRDIINIAIERKLQDREPHQRPRMYLLCFSPYPTETLHFKTSI